MKLISTYNNLPITVHFDVNSVDADTNYYTSLHPRTMNVTWNNKFHVALPPKKFDHTSQQKRSDKLRLCCHKEAENEPSQRMSISISAMIHNVEDFKINYDDLTATNLLSMADMTASTQSYTFPDIISNFYGISNSIISVLDSISDIVFIVFLWRFVEIENYGKKQFDATEKITTFLMTLSIGNLLSVGIAIALYTTNKIETNTRWQKTILCLVFFMLSPCLPAFEWIIQKVQNYNTEVLVVYPACDGLLVWFEQELGRNEIFVLESVMESSFQIVIQFIAIFVLETVEYKDA
eukprot:133620_1